LFPLTINSCALEDRSPILIIVRHAKCYRTIKCETSTTNKMFHTHDNKLKQEAQLWLQASFFSLSVTQR